MNCILMKNSSKYIIDYLENYQLDYGCNVLSYNLKLSKNLHQCNRNSVVIFHS